MSNAGNCENMENNHPIQTESDNNTILSSAVNNKGIEAELNVNLKSSPVDVVSNNKPQQETDLIKKVNELNISNNSAKEGTVVRNLNSESLNSLLIYDSDSSSTSEDENVDWKFVQGQDSDDSTLSDSDKEDEQVNLGAISKKRDENIKNKDELDIANLPPVPDLSNLNINVENEEFLQVGSILGIIGKLVTVAALPDTPAYDLDTLLFVENGKKPLGFIFEVLGQVTSPIYAVRFNCEQDIYQQGITKGMKVFVAPKSKYTNYVFLQQLLKMKGSDASWFGDEEVPSEFADYSDDEAECFAKSGNSSKLQLHTKRPSSNSSSIRHKKFESTMNKRNLINTKLNKYIDSHKKSRIIQKPTKTNDQLPNFDPSIPPPNIRLYDGMGSYGGLMGFNVDRVRFMNLDNRNLNTMYNDMNMLFNRLDQTLSSDNNSSSTSNPSQPSVDFGLNLFNNSLTTSTSNNGSSSSLPLNENNSANYFTNQSGNVNPGPSHQ